VASAYGPEATERLVAEPPKRSGRTAFERDRARIVHSAALRRLAAKTQVHGPGTDDFVRNRLTHSLEVAQIGRELGAALGCDADLVDAACLAHDLGHPPFGHNGEQALDEAAAECGGFEGNAQTLRVLTRLEAKTVAPDGESVGLNLTRATLDAATKYPWQRGAGAAHGKFGVYADDAEAFAWLRDGARPGRPCVEAQVMDVADDIAYSVHDVEDGVHAGQVDLRALGSKDERAAVFAVTRRSYEIEASDDELAEALDRLTRLDCWPREIDGSRRAMAALKTMTSDLIGRFCTSIEAATRAAHGTADLVRHGGDVVVPRETMHEIAVLKGIAATYVMFTDRRADALARERKIVCQLVHLVAAAAPAALAPSLRADWLAADSDAARLRVVVDHVASLTDVSAVAEHARLAGE
jgi:dGTPase